MDTAVTDTSMVTPAPAPLAATGGAAVLLENIGQKILAGGEPSKPDWEKFQIGLLQMNMEIASDGKSSARVKADAVGKMLWATQMNLDRFHSERRLRDEYEQRDELEKKRLERRMDLEQVMKGHRWRTKTRKEWGDAIRLPEDRKYAIPPYKTLAPKWPVKDGAPPVKDEEFDGEAVPHWVYEYSLGRPVEADDLPDEVYWFGRRPERFEGRKKEALFRIVKFRDGNRETVYRKTARGKSEFPDLVERAQGTGYVLLDDDEISEYEAKAFGEQPPLKGR